MKEIDINGKKKYGSVYSRSYREVKLKRQDALDQLLRYQKPVSVRNVSVSELIEEWLYVNKPRLKLSTYQRYCGFWNNHIKNLIGNMKAMFLTTVILREYAIRLINTGLSAQTVNSVLIFLHSSIKYGHQQYGLPMPEFTYFRAEHKEMRVFSQEEQSRLVEYLLDEMDVYKFGVLIALYTGMRVGELCALKWEDIENGCINVRRTMQRLQKENGEGTEISIGPPKTKKSMRTIPILSSLEPFILRFKDDYSNPEYVIGTKTVSITEPRVMQYKFQKYMKELAIEGATFHTLRHTFATRAIEVNVEVKALSELLGHASVQTTLNRYVHSSLAHKRANVEKLNSFFKLIDG